MKLWRKTASTLALILALSMLVMACGSPSEPAANGGASTAPEATAGTSEPGPAGEKVLRMARTWEEKSFDPATFTGANQITLASQMFEPLFKIAEDGSIAPLLAESSELSDDGLTLTIHLRQGVQWHHDYGEFTSADVLFTFERHADPAVASVHQEALNLANIASIETPDAYTVVFHFNIPDVDFLTRCAQYVSIISCKAYYDEKGNDGIASFPIGTGPYEYDQGTPGVETQVIAFDEYWGGRPAIDRIINTIISDPVTVYTAFDNGELDLIPVSEVEKANEYQAAGYNLYHQSANELLYLGCNMQLAPFDDPLVRESYYAAIDPQYYIDNIHLGNEEYTGGWIPPHSKYTLGNIVPAGYDPEKAKALLAEAGYPDGLSITLWSVNDATSTAPALITENQLAAAGFNVELQLVDFGVFIDKVRGGEAAMWLLYNYTPALADETIVRYTSAAYPGSNWCGTTDSAYDALVQKGLDAQTEAEKRQYFDEAQIYFANLRVLYPICTQGNYYITQPNVTGIEMWGDQTMRLHNAAIQ